MKDNNSVLAIIPARAGSKGLSRKNIRHLCGKPLISYTIREALQSPSVERVIVSTEDDEIAEISREYGAEVPFMRPADLAGDNVPEHHVFIHALKWLKKKENYMPELVLSLKCTAPLRKAEDIEAVVKKLKTSGCDSVRTMTRVHGVYHPYWMYRECDDRVVPFVEGLDITAMYQRQLLPPVFRLNGVVDGAHRWVIMENPGMWGDTMAMVEIPEERAVDIDTELDFRFAEYLMRLNNGCNS